MIKLPILRLGNRSTYHWRTQWSDTTKAGSYWGGEGVYSISPHTHTSTVCSVLLFVKVFQRSDGSTTGRVQQGRSEGRLRCHQRRLPLDEEAPGGQTGTDLFPWTFSSTIGFISVNSKRMSDQPWHICWEQKAGHFLPLRASAGQSCTSSQQQVCHAITPNTKYVQYSV